MIGKKTMKYIQDISGNSLRVDLITEIKEDKQYTYSDDVYELITNCITSYFAKVGEEWHEISYNTYRGLKNEQKHILERH